MGGHGPGQAGVGLLSGRNMSQTSCEGESIASSLLPHTHAGCAWLRRQDPVLTHTHMQGVHGHENRASCCHTQAGLHAAHRQGTQKNRSSRLHLTRSSVQNYPSPAHPTSLPHLHLPWPRILPQVVLSQQLQQGAAEGGLVTIANIHRGPDPD